MAAVTVPRRMHVVCRSSADKIVPLGDPWSGRKSGEAELAAGHKGIAIFEVGIAICAPGAIAKDLQGASDIAIYVDPAHQPHCSLAT